MRVRPICELICDIKFSFLRHRTIFPDMPIVWPDIIGRTTQRLARSVEKINQAFIKVNKEVGRVVICNRGLVIGHLEVETLQYLWDDGIHLNAIGTDVVLRVTGWGCNEA